MSQTLSFLSIFLYNHNFNLKFKLGSNIILQINYCIIYINKAVQCTSFDKNINTTEFNNIQ